MAMAPITAGMTGTGRNSANTNEIYRIAIPMAVQGFWLIIRVDGIYAGLLVWIRPILVWPVLIWSILIAIGLA